MKFCTADIFLFKNPEFLEKIFKNSHRYYQFAKTLIEKGKEVPNFILDKISESVYYSYGVSIFLLEKDKEVPEIIINGISKKFRNAYNYAIFLIDNDEKIPKIILKSVIKTDEYTAFYTLYDLAEHLIKKGREILEYFISRTKKEIKNYTTFIFQKISSIEPNIKYIV